MHDPTDQHPAVRNEQVLARQLSTVQQMAMALGGAIGTGLFLASGLSVNVAGPAVVLSYVIVAGAQLVAASIYMGDWFPEVPGAVWVLAFSVVLIYVNSRAVGRLGTTNPVLVISGLTGGPAIGLGNLTGQGGFLPFGLKGVWLGFCFVRRMVLGLSAIYIVTITLLVALTPWNQLGVGALIAAILISTWWVPGLRSTLMAGGPWLLLLAVGYRFTSR